MNLIFKPTDAEAEHALVAAYDLDPRGVLIVPNADVRRRIIESYRLDDAKTRRVLPWFKREHLRGLHYPHAYVLAADRVLRELFFPACIVHATMQVGAKIEDTDAARMPSRDGFHVTVIG